MQAPGQHVGVLCFGQRDDVQEVVGNLDALDQVHQSLVGQKRIQIIRCHGSVIPAGRHGCDGPQPLTYGGNDAFFRAWDASSRTTATRARTWRVRIVMLESHFHAAFGQRYEGIRRRIRPDRADADAQRRRSRLELRQRGALAQRAGIGEFQRSAVGRAAPAAEAVHEQRRQLGRRGEMEFHIAIGQDQREAARVARDRRAVRSPGA